MIIAQLDESAFAQLEGIVGRVEPVGDAAAVDAHCLPSQVLRGLAEELGESVV